MLKNKKGITLIALVVTIVVLIILATISISVAINGGIIGKAQDAKTYYESQGDEFNKFTVAADANKLLVPTYPIQRDNESSTDYEARLQKDYYDVSSISGIFKSFSDAPGGFKEEMQEVNWSLGGEYTYNDKFSLRAGYHHESENKGNRKYFTVGAGFKMNAFTLDAGYVIATAKSNPLDQTLRFTLAFDLDGIKDLFKKK